MGQVARNTVGGRRQKPFPLNFKVAYGLLVAAARVVPRGGLNIDIDFIHGTGHCASSLSSSPRRTSTSAQM